MVPYYFFLIKMEILLLMQPVMFNKNFWGIKENVSERGNRDFRNQRPGNIGIFQVIQFKVLRTNDVRWNFIIIQRYGRSNCRRVVFSYKALSSINFEIIRAQNIGSKQKSELVLHFNTIRFFQTFKAIQQKRKLTTYSFPKNQTASISLITHFRSTMKSELSIGNNTFYFMLQLPLFHSHLLRQ